MTTQWRRLRIDRSLRRQASVSIDELVEAYCDLEATPTGRVPTAGSIELVRRKVAEAAAAHRLNEVQTADGVEPRSRRWRWPVLTRSSAAATTYLIALGDAVDVVTSSDGVTVVRRSDGAVLALAPRERGRELSRATEHVHLFDRADAALAAFGLFDTE